MLLGGGAGIELLAQRCDGGRSVATVRRVYGGPDQFGEQRTGPLRRKGGGELLPVDVRDGDRGVAVVERVVERRNREVGAERRQPPPPVEGERRLVGGHARLAPGAPGDAGGGESLEAAVFGEGVEVGVGGGVGGLSTAAPGSRTGREEDERAEVEFPREFVQMRGAESLGLQHMLEAFRREIGDQFGVGGTGGVDDGSEGVGGGDGSDEVVEGGGVGDVAGGDGDGGAEFGEFLGEFGGAGGVGAGAAGEVEVGCAVAGEPACEVGAEPAGAAGDERRPGRLPRNTARGRKRSTTETACVGAGGADRGLILGLPGREKCRETVGGVVIDDGREIDQATPATGVFQRGRSAESPGLRLARIGERIGGMDGDGTLGEAPQGRGDLGVTEGLDEGGGGDEPGGNRGVGGMRLLREREQTHDPGRLIVEGEPGEFVGQITALGLTGIERLGEGSGAVGGERLYDGRDGRVIGLVGRDEHQPGAGEGGGRDGRGKLLPGGPIPPRVDDRLFAMLPPPGRQSRQYGAQHGLLIGGGVEGCGERFQILALDGFPERPVRLRGLGDGRGPLGGGEPEVLALEGVGG